MAPRTRARARKARMLVLPYCRIDEVPDWKFGPPRRGRYLPLRGGGRYLPLLEANVCPSRGQMFAPEGQIFNPRLPINPIAERAFGRAARLLPSLSCERLFGTSSDVEALLPFSYQLAPVPGCSTMRFVGAMVSCAAGPLEHHLLLRAHRTPQSSVPKKK